MFKTSCERCGKEVEYRFASKAKRFCSRACADAARRVEPVRKQCAVCGAQFEVIPSQADLYATCSHECSLKYRSMNSSGRAMTWGDKISAARDGKPIDTSYITPEYREGCRQRAIDRGFGQVTKGQALSEEHKDKIRQAHVGHSRGGWKMVEELCQGRRDRAKKGEESHLWKGGVTPINAAIRTTYEYKAWRRAVFERDGFTCQVCGAKGVELNADHIKPFAYFPELRFDVSNGRTLCVPCHKKTPTYLGGAQKLAAAGAFDKEV